MHSMGINRRQFLLGLGLLSVLPTDYAQASLHLPPGTTDLYLAARKNANRYEAAVFDVKGRDHLVVPLPDRGHSFAIDAPRGRVVAFGRQPGFFAIAFELGGKGEYQTLGVAPSRHFFGHGTFSPDGLLMFATENNYADGVGVLGVYDTSRTGAYRRIGEFPSGGVGPHEVILMPDGKTLCVANGGILTHPDYGKLQLNGDTMKPSLAYIDLQTGQLLEQIYLPDELNRLSIRHLVLDDRGAVWFGCQHTGPAVETPPLVGRHRRGERAQLYEGPNDVLRGMRNYVGSLACDVSNGTVATSSPVGGCLVYWDTVNGQVCGQTKFFDGCGVASRQDGGYVESNGQGVLLRTDGMGQNTVLLKDAPEQSWDNHLRRI